jgi:hypothetical protein
VAKRIKAMSRDVIIDRFPELAYDPNFKITSNETGDYNCIAWAYNGTERWMWPKCENYPAILQNRYFWSKGVTNTNHVSAFIEAFSQTGYQLCDTWQHEDGYQKIALYTKTRTCECTHAARELVENDNVCGKWTSKLGVWNDIQHSTPYRVEGVDYGMVYCFMKRKIT